MTMKAMFALLCASVIGASAAADTTTMTVNDIRVTLEAGIKLLGEKINASKTLSEEDRVSISRDIENQAEEMREALDKVANDAIVMGNRTYPVGIVLTYIGEVGFPSFIPSAHYGPGAEAGVALFLKRNSYLSEAIRGADVMVLSGGVNVQRNRVLPQNRSTERGLELKVLFASDLSAPSLSTFEGFYTGVGAKLGLLGGRDLGDIYTKPQTCKNLNPFDCDVYVWRVGGLRTREMQGEVKEIYINFPHSNDKRGYRFF